MALNSSGPISLGGATTGESINIELGQSSITTVSLNDTNVRTLAGVASGTIVMPTDFWGKSSASRFISVFQSSQNMNVPTDQIVSVDSSGNYYVLWANTSGTDYSCFLYKFNSSWTLQWQKRYYWSASVFASVLVSGSNIYLVDSATGYPGVTGRRPAIFKLDLDGNYVSSKVMDTGGTTTSSYTMYNINITSDGYINYGFERATNIGRAALDTSLNVVGNYIVRSAGLRGSGLNSSGTQVIMGGTGGTGYAAWINVAPSNTGVGTQYGITSTYSAGNALAINPTSGEVFQGIVLGAWGLGILRYSSSYTANLLKTFSPGAASSVINGAIHNGTYLYVIGTLNSVLTLWCFDNDLNMIWVKSFSSTTGAITTAIRGLKIASDGDLIIGLRIGSTPNSTVLIKTKSDGSQLSSLNVTVSGVNFQSASGSTVSTTSQSFTTASTSVVSAGTVNSNALSTPTITTGTSTITTSSI